MAEPADLGLRLLIIWSNQAKMLLFSAGTERNLSMHQHGFANQRQTIQSDALICNIGSGEDVRKAGEYLVKNSLSVEYLFNNAGIGLFANAEASTSAMIDTVFEANLKGMILLTSEILRITPKEEELTIVNIMSTSALIGRAQETIYCAAKFGARGYTEALRTEFKGTRRNIIAVYPGGMRTDFWNIIDENKDLSRFMDPAEVAEKIVNAVTVSDKMLVTDITINRK